MLTFFVCHGGASVWRSWWLFLSVSSLPSPTVSGQRLRCRASRLCTAQPIVPPLPFPSPSPFGVRACCQARMYIDNTDIGGRTDITKLHFANVSESIFSVWLLLPFHNPVTNCLDWNSLSVCRDFTANVFRADLPWSALVFSRMFCFCYYATLRQSLGVWIIFFPQRNLRQ